MPSPVPRGDVELVLGRMGCKVLKREGRFTAFEDRVGPRIFMLSFEDDEILWDDLASSFEYEGVSRDVFLAELESL